MIAAVLWLAAGAPPRRRPRRTVRSGAADGRPWGPSAGRWPSSRRAAGRRCARSPAAAARHPGAWGSARRAAGARRRASCPAARRAGRWSCAWPRTTRPAGACRCSCARRGDGVVALRAEVAGRPAGVRAVGIAFGAPPGERHLGFGERSDAVDQRGRDGRELRLRRPVAGGRRAPSRAARCRRRASARATTRPTSPSRGCSPAAASACSSTATRRARSASAPRGGRAWSVEVAAPALALRVFAGPTPAAALRPLHRARSGASRRRPAPWAFGPWLQTGQPNAPPLADQVADLAKLRAADAPVSAAETQLRYLPCGLDRGLEAYEAERVAFYHREGLAVLTYVNPMLCQSYEPLFSQAVAAGALQRTADGRVATVRLVRRRHGPGGLHDPARRPVRLLPPRRRRRLRRRPAPDRRDRPRRLDGGLRRVHAARGRGRRADRHRRPQPLPDVLPLRGARHRPRAAAGPPGRALPALGLDRRGALRRRRLGRRPDDDVRLRRPVLRGAPGAQHRAVGRSAAGARTSAATTRSATTRS